MLKKLIPYGYAATVVTLYSIGLSYFLYCFEPYPRQSFWQELFSGILNCFLPPYFGWTMLYVGLILLALYCDNK